MRLNRDGEDRMKLSIIIVNYNTYELTKQTYQDVKDAGFNIAIYNGELDYSTQENIRIAGICEELGLKFIGHNPYYATHADRVKAIKDAFGDSETYIGEYQADEPNESTFPQHAEFTREFAGRYRWRSGR